MKIRSTQKIHVPLTNLAIVYNIIPKAKARHNMVQSIVQWDMTSGDLSPAHVTSPDQSYLFVISITWGMIIYKVYCDFTPSDAECEEWVREAEEEVAVPTSAAAERSQTAVLRHHSGHQYQMCLLLHQGTVYTGL